MRDEYKKFMIMRITTTRELLPIKAPTMEAALSMAMENDLNWITPVYRQVNTEIDETASFEDYSEKTKRRRKTGKKMGRPKGSKNKPKEK